MSVRKRVLSALIAASMLAASAPVMAKTDEAKLHSDVLPYQDTTLSFEERAADLVSRMTLEEKAAQTRAKKSPAISRLGVSEYNYWSEGIHGVARQGAATSFPVSLALSNTWDRQLMYEVMDITSTEARGKNNRHNLSYWNPTINMARDPRWGRNEESYGEDPYLTAQLGEKAVEGMQGSDEKYLKVISTLKHFAANNVEGERQRGTSIMTDKTLREYYTRAFKDITESGANPASVMSSYNAETITRNGETVTDYIASSANKYLLTDLLRRSWGFSGYVVGDCGAFENLYSKPSLAIHLFPGMAYRDITPAMTVSKAFEAGADLDCGGAAPASSKEAVDMGHMSEDTLDIALYRLFLERMKTGEFDDGATYQDIKSSVIETDEHVAKAEEAAEKSWVLLENKNNALPLGASVKKVAVVGDMANEVTLGDYSGSPTKTKTPIQGIREELSKHNISTEYLGSAAADAKLFNIQSITLVKKDGSKTKLDLSKAESVSGMTLSGGKLIDVMPGAGAVIRSVNFKDVATVEAEIATGARVGGTVNILYGNGGPSVASVKSKPTADENTYVTCSGEYGGEDGGYNAEADMYITCAAPTGFEIDSYKAQLDAADYIIAYAGTKPFKTGDAGESNDRKSIDLPAHQAHVEKLMNSEYASKTILVMSTVGQMNIEAYKDKCAAILWTSYNGQTQGTALGKVLSGDVNPSGRLTTTWYAASDLEKMPLGSERIKKDVGGGTAELYYTSYEIAQAENYPGRTYQYYGGTPVYPFGYGKSYTSFEYSNITVDKASADANETVTITADVKNTGTKAGAEVAQLYVTVPGADGKKLPLKQLKGFERVELNAGESKTVSFALDIADVNFYDEALQKNYVVNGEYSVKVAPNANADGVSAKFNVTGTLSNALKNVTAIPTGIQLIGASDGTNVYPANEIDAQVSAALDDDTLITDLSGATVTYTSSNSNVAAVDANGIVKAVNTAGTALITVSVTMNGVTKTDSFPVVTSIKEKISDEKTAQNLAALEAAYKAHPESVYTPENYAALTAIYERYKTRISESVIAEESDAYLADALKEISEIPIKELLVKNAKDGKIVVTVPFDSAVLIEAKYDGGILKEVKTNPIQSEGDYELSGYAEGDNVKLMIWDSLQGMKPLLAAVDHQYKAPVQLNKILFDFANPAFDSFFETGDGDKLESADMENVNGIKIYGYGGWATDTHKRSMEYDGETLTFTRGLKGGGGNKTKKCVYFTPESDGILTVFFSAASDRKVIIEQNGVTEEKFGDTAGDSVLVAFEREITAGEPVYVYGGGSNKFIYGMMFRTDGKLTPATPKPTEAPLPEIGETKKIEVENYVKTWPEPGAKRISTKDVEGASNGKLVDNTKEGDIIYLGTHSMDKLTAIDVMAGTKESSAAASFYAADITGIDVNTAAESDISALLTADNLLGKTNLVSSGNWNELHNAVARVNNAKSGTLGLFMKCTTSASYCGNFDYINLMYAADSAAVAALKEAKTLKTVEWNGTRAALVREDSRTKVMQVISDEVMADITPDAFAESDLGDNAALEINDILAVEDRLYLGCNGGAVVTLTPCSRCSVLKKVCDFDIKSLEYADNELTLSNGDEVAVISLADAGGYSVSAETAAEMVAEGAALVDVRSAEEFAEGGAMDGAVNVPLDEFAAWLEAKPQNEAVVVYCSSGKRAAQAAKTAVDMGYTKVYAIK